MATEAQVHFDHFWAISARDSRHRRAEKVAPR